jgi:hypothetical protein
MFNLTCQSFEIFEILSVELEFPTSENFEKPPGSGIFSQRVASLVSSALRRFTSVFGMGTGGTTSL